MMRARAALLEEREEPLRIREVEIDEPQPDEVVVRVAAAGVCQSDIGVMDGDFTVGSLPMAMGHESAGIVQSVGAAVDYVRPGDRVITMPTSGLFCGRCEYCQTGQPYLCTKIGVSRSPDDRRCMYRGKDGIAQVAGLGSFSERLLFHQKAHVKLPEEMSLDVALLIGCGVQTGVGAVLNLAAVEPGSTVAVLGCGGVGLSSIQAARIAGAGQIIAIDRVGSRLELARSFGATDTLDASEVDPVVAVRELTEGRGVDYPYAQAAGQDRHLRRRPGTRRGHPGLVAQAPPEERCPRPPSMKTQPHSG